MSQTAISEPSSLADRLPLSYKWVALGVVMLGAFMSILNNSLINVAIPKIMTVFNASADQIQWILTGYMLAMGMVIPVTGYLSDRLGSKRLYIIAMAIFTLGSALCGLSWGTSSMVGFRVFQAIGGGMIMPVSMSIIFLVVPYQQRGLALGIWGIAAMAAPAVGPTISGYIIQFMDWRLLFYVNVPIGIITILLAAVLLQESERHHGLEFDYLGFLTSSVFCFCFLLALAQGNKEGWDSFYILSLLFISFCSLAAFVVIELNHRQPLLDLRLFKNVTFTMSIVVGSILGIGLFGGVWLVPLFLQNLMGLSPIQTGLILFPSAAATAIFMPISGRLFDLIGARPLVFTGIILAGWGTLEMSHLTLDTPFALIVSILLFRGIGIGLSSMPAGTAGMNTVPLAKVARASALSNVVRQISASFGIAYLTAIMQRQQIFHLNDLAQSVSHSYSLTSTLGQLQTYLVQHGSSAADAKLQSSAIISGLIQKQATVMAINDAFWVAGIICFIGLPLTYFLKSRRSDN